MVQLHGPWCKPSPSYTKQQENNERLVPKGSYDMALRCGENHPLFRVNYTHGVSMKEGNGSK